MSTKADEPSQPSAIPDPEKQQARKKTEREEKEEFLPAPAPEEQKKTVEQWQRPPGQNSG